MTDGSSNTGDKARQLRLALSMNGGVSLAVWIGGAVSEIDCLRCGDGFWGDLLKGCGFQREALVDVMTGASAGGLNAVLMAQAIRSCIPFSNFLTLWQDHADIDRLLKGPLRAAKDDERAVLKGRYFLQSLRDALKEPAQMVSLTQNLAVFASATLVRPNPVEFRDVPGAPIAETRSDAYFHIARRGSSTRGLDAFEPSDLVIDNVDALALVGRATSSLPGLFEPVKFQQSSFGARLVGGFTRLRNEVEVMDGGVIDNVPISRAIRAIANSPADGRVRRVLLYLHPDPGGRRGPCAGRDPTTALQVVQSFFGKRKETIREDIELLRSHNDAVERRRDEGDSLLKSFSDPQYSVDDRERALLAQSINAAMLLRAAIDPPSELTWHAPNVPRLVPLVDDPQDPSKAELAADIRQVVEDPDVLVAVATRRIVLALQRIISSIGAAAPEADFDHVQSKVYELSLLCDVITSYQLARFLGHGSGSAATTRLSLSRRELDDIRVGDQLDDQTWNALASWDLSGATPVATGQRLGDHLASLVTKLIDHMPEPPKKLRIPAAEVLRKLKSGAVNPAALDQALLPLAAESVASDQPIEFVRVAGDVSTPASEAFNLSAKPGQPKIAGLQLHHLGAFFHRDWRTNDWWWGRLDSVRALLDVVLDDEAVQAMRSSGYLAAHDFDDSDRTVDDIKHWLLEKRQLELLNERCGKQPNFDAAIHSDEFIAWARSDRRLSSLLGTRTLTSTAIRGVITSSKILRVGLSSAAQVALTVIRPVLLATAGIALAGRRAAAAVAWTVCVMVASRSNNHNDRWALWVVGLALSAGIAVLVEVKIRPAYTSPLQLWPYAYAAAGVIAGAVACAKYDWLRGTNETPAHPSSLLWMIPPIAAAASAAMLFFWMRWWAGALLTGLTALLYLHFAHAAYLAQIGHPLDNWPQWWMFHSMVVCWVIAILVIPLLLGFMNDNMLRPHPIAPARQGLPAVDKPVAELANEMPQAVHLTDGRSSLLITTRGGMPCLVHWGAALGDTGRAVIGALERPVPGGGLDIDPPLGLVAESSAGWFGAAGIEGHRPDGRDFAPQFSLQSIDSDGHRADIGLADEAAQLSLTVGVVLHASGVATFQASLSNDGDTPYELDALRLSLPVPAQAQELLTVGGRWTNEFGQTRTPWIGNCLTIENRRGKTSHERLGAVFAGTPAFTEHSGEVWACHIGWSGNFEIICDSVTDGRRSLQAGELLASGEVSLQPGQRYDAPLIYAAYSNSGLNAISNSFHAFLRSRPQHPVKPRPVLLNIWEAVYFDHDYDNLRGLADIAASCGIERFVVDDGWFHGRRNDRAGLGDWWVDTAVWTSGLTPLIDHVRELGMEFGIWVEPEMVNPDSDLYRAHPDWTLGDDRYPVVLGRNQLVLDLGRDEVCEYLFGHLDALLGDHDIAYVKWDMNRDLVAATSAGRAGVHRQTLGVYALFDRLRSAHPGVEFETCASGGGRVDFGIFERAERAWTSDSIDALDRQEIQRGFSLLFPPELMGSHIGSPVAHTTGRSHGLGFRAIAAIFGSLGIEWNLLKASDSDRADLAEIIALHKRLRPLLHHGDVVRVDHPDPTVMVHGVVAADRSSGVFACTRLKSGPSLHTAPIRLPSLDPARTYDVVNLPVGGERWGPARRQPAWLTTGLRMTGQQLSVIGFSAPVLLPETSMLIHVAAAT